MAKIKSQDSGLGPIQWSITIRWQGGAKRYWVIATPVLESGRTGLPLVQTLENELHPHLNRDLVAEVLKSMQRTYAAVLF